MYLKEIIINGFKSFADKTVISLDEGVTCVVGPNGSGKSNVVDAVRFVLGEQSVKSLRGDSLMSDIIFSGSKSRSSLNIASVELVFDNCDNVLPIPFLTVSVKRKIYNNGDNEYYLNNEKCRLKDITNLFLDSNIGKSSFNIISQGDVFKILNGTSIDRRVIFEEASGVLKYKKRKEEALKKLERTDDNLIRINDIIIELERQVAPLKEQSIKAVEYLDIKEDLSKIEISLLTSEITDLNTKYSESKTKFNEMNNQLELYNTNYNTSNVEIEKINNSLIMLEVEYKEINKLFLNKLSQFEKLSNDLVLVKERSKKSLDGNKTFLLKEQILQLENTINEVLLEINLLEKSVSNIKLLDDDINIIMTKINNVNNKIIEYDKELYGINNHLDNLMSKNYHIKKLLNMNILGVHNTLDNLIKIDSKYLLPLLVSLGNGLNNVIVDNEMVAKEAIFYLKSNGLSRITFLPISIIKPKGIDEETLNTLSNSEGFIDILSNLVKYENIYRNIILNTLGNTIVVVDIDCANTIAKRINYRYKIVTLTGEIIHAGGSVTGGTFKNNIISDKEEINKLSTKKNKLETQLDSLNKDLKELNTNYKELDDKNILNKKELFNLNNNLEIKNQNIVNFNIELDLLNNELRTYNSISNNTIDALEEDILNKYYNSEKEKDELNSKLKFNLLTKDKLNSLKDELEYKERIKLKDLRELESSVKDISLNISKIELKLDNNLNILNEDYELTYESALLKYNLEIDLDVAKEKVREYKFRLKEIGMVNIDSIKEYESVSTRYNFLNTQKKDLVSAKDELFNIIKTMDDVMEKEFISTFKEVEKEFSKVYKELFDGGNASLVLTNKDNILETGVDIIACPPGKKLTSINLLSGGEKTLTAISLLFAILNVKKVPFCLFDEVEAALDEVNVDTFGKYLNNYRNKTQFLIITHKKKTMEYADTLYGVTMQESGVSKLVSVRLKDMV